MRIALVRHGETDWNLTGRLQGVSDIPLNETGRAQMARSAEALADGNWGTVVSSPLMRARQSADIIAFRLGRVVSRTYAGLSERDFGEAEGMLGAEAERLWPLLDGPGMEKAEDVALRGHSALARIADEHPSGDVVVVCHSFVIVHTLRTLGHEVRSDIANGAIFHLEQSNGGWNVTK